MQTREIDVLVIGSGPSGQKAAIQSSKSGMSVIVVEGWETGGSSLWTATIPSKSLREAIIDLTNFKRRSFYAEMQDLPSTPEILLADITYRLNWVKMHLKELITRQLQKNNIEVVRGFAKFIDPHVLNIYDGDVIISTIRAKKIILTTGSKPRRPEFISDSKLIFNSTQLLSLEKIPKSMVVVGAGVIGTEYASMFCLLGTRVTLVDKRDRILSFLDMEIGSHLQLALEENNLKFLGNKEYTSVKEDDGEVVVSFKDGSEVRAEVALVAAGREANIDCLGLEHTGIEVKKGGYVEVNEHYQTTVSHIYAAGDVIGGPCLSSTGYVQGRLAAMNACGKTTNRFDQMYPFGIYTIPEISFIGKTEEELRLEGVEYEVGRAYFYEISRSVVTGSESGFCKLIFDPKKLNLLGAHIIGPEATELIHIAQVAISLNATIEYFVEQVFNFPTFAEMYRIASLNGLNKLSKLKVE